MTLVAACRAGEDAAFELLVLRHQKRMLNLAFRILNDYEEALEVVQDAFLAAYRELASFRGEARFTTWLTTITLNLARNGYARLASRRKREAYSLDAPLPEGDPRPEPPSFAPTALEQMEKRALQKQLEHCLGILPMDFREAWVLREVQDQSYQEIAAMLKLREGTVKSRIFRARDLLKDCLRSALGAL